eukprot:1959268-Amphidinium_carterae.1
MAMMYKYPNAEKAFKIFDINRNGSLSLSEFAQYAKTFFTGDVTSVYKVLSSAASAPHKSSLSKAKVLAKWQNVFAKNNKLLKQWMTLNDLTHGTKVKLLLVTSELAWNLLQEVSFKWPI